MTLVVSVPAGDGSATTVTLAPAVPDGRPTSLAGMADIGTQLDIADGDRGFVLAGEIDAHTAPMLEKSLAERLSSGSVHTDLDLRGVTFMDSSGLRVVVAATEALRAVDGDLTLVAPTSSVAKLIEVSGLSDHLSIASAG